MYTDPFGSQWLFAEKGLKLLGARILGKNRNVLKLQVSNHTGIIMEAMYFGDPETFLREVADRYGENERQKLCWGRENAVYASFIYYPSVNEYQGRRTLQIVIKNYQIG